MTCGMMHLKSVFDCYHVFIFRVYILGWFIGGALWLGDV